MNADKVLELHKEGLSNREIARRLGRETQESTVRGIIARNTSPTKYVRKTPRTSSPTGDGWIENKGHMPVSKGTKVHVLHRTDKEYVDKAGHVGFAHDWSLGNRKNDGDILKWKLA